MLGGLFARAGALMARGSFCPRLSVEDGTVQAEARQAPPPRLTCEAAEISAEARG